MISEVVRPYRSAESLKRLGIALLINLVPLAGTVWFYGWLLAHMRATAWRSADTFPPLKPWDKRFETGFWGMLIAYVWTLPAQLLVLPVAMVVFTSAVMAPLLETATTSAAQGAGGTAQMQAQVVVAMTERIIPAVIGITALSIIATLLTIPLSYAAVSRYALWATTREGFNGRQVISSLRRGGRASFVASLAAAAPTLITLPIMLLGMAGMLRLSFTATIETDPALMARAGAIWFAWYLLIMALGLVSSAASPAIMGAWGVWARRAYPIPASSSPDLSTGAPEPTETR